MPNLRLARMISPYGVAAVAALCGLGSGSWISALYPHAAPAVFESLLAVVAFAALGGGLGPGLLALLLVWILGPAMVLGNEDSWSFDGMTRMAMSSHLLPTGLLLCGAVAYAGTRGLLFRRDHTASAVATLKRMRDARNKAQAESHAKSRYLANLTHEIRTPLAAILGFSELLLEPEQSVEERVSFINIIRRNGELLSQIIGNVLDLSKIEAGRMEIETIPVDVRRLVEEVIESLELRASGKGLALERDFCGLPAQLEVATDPTRLKQILVNVVGNAVKFTERGRVRVVVCFAPDEGRRRGRVEILVKDTGIGVSAEQRCKIFQRYEQSDVSTTRKYGGTGLGLHLSRHLAHLLGGELALTETSVGSGSTFRLSIDAEVVAPSAVAEFRRVGFEAGVAAPAGT